MIRMSDCIYIVTQEELNKAISELAEAIRKAVVPTCEEILQEFANILGLADAAEDVYSPRPKPKRPQRNLFFRYEPMLDKRVQIHKYRRR